MADERNSTGTIRRRSVAISSGESGLLRYGLLHLWRGFARHPRNQHLGLLWKVRAPGPTIRVAEAAALIVLRRLDRSSGWQSFAAALDAAHP